jgi:hypothetical protein
MRAPIGTAVSREAVAGERADTRSTRLLNANVERSRSMARRLDYLVLRIVAIVMALGLTGYSAWLSWAHFGEPTGPIAAATGAGLFVFGEYAWRDRQRLRAMLLFGLGALALAISGTVVLHRVSATEEARLQAARSTNLPRVEAAKALSDAQEALAAAVAAAEGECRSGRGARCAGLEQREEAARQRVAEARTKLVGLGAQAAEDPGTQHIAALLSISAARYQQIAPALLPMWLELTAPLLLSIGLAPSGRQARAQVRTRRKRKKRRGPRSVNPSAVIPLRRSN